MLPSRVEIIGRAGDTEICRGCLEPGKYIIGSEPGCAVEVNLDGVSPQHARLVVTGDALFVEDLGSEDGTHVGSERIVGCTAVAPGVWFRIGEALFQWHTVAAPVAASRPAAVPRTVAAARPVVKVAQAPRPRQPMAPRVPVRRPVVTAPKPSPLLAVLAIIVLAVLGVFFIPGLFKRNDAPAKTAAAPAPPKAESTPAPAIVPQKPEPTPEPVIIAKAGEPAPRPAPMPEPAKTTPTPAPAPVVAAKPADDYPGVPVLSLSTTVLAGDPDFQKLLGSAKWAATNGKWDRLRGDLQNALVTLAGSGSSLARVANIERMLELRTPSAAFAQERFIRAIGEGVLKTFATAPDHQEFVQWLFAHPAVITAFSDTILPKDKPREALMAWWEIWKSDEEGREPFANLAIACALVFDQPVRLNPAIFGVEKGSSGSDSIGIEKEASAVKHYTFFRDSSKRGALRAPITEMTPRDLAWVVDAPVPESELIWAQKHMSLSRTGWSGAYGMIRYRMDRATQGVNPYKAYTLAEIMKEGGICGDQAYFAAITAKANGIPAMVISGEGDRGGHAWFGYKTSRNGWNLTSGRYADNYAAGTTTDPQTHERLNEHELKMFADPVRRTEAYAKGEHLVALAKMFAAAKRDDLATVAIDAALKLTPKHLDAWFEKLAAMRTANVATEDWQRETARMRTTFHDYSDVVQKIGKMEADYLAQTGDLDAARKLVRKDAIRMTTKDKERTDLILDSVFREAELAEATGDAEKIGRIYRGAMREKGGELVAFRKIAKRYYEWGKKSSLGQPTVRDILSTFGQKHKEPTGDVFAMGAYRGALADLIAMVKEQGMATQEHTLDRREAKLKALQEKTGKEQSKNAAK